MTNAALRGKPDAGNPHVRFDEGEVASAATPRHGSLLYKKTVIVNAHVVSPGVDIENADGQLLVIAGNDGQWGSEGKNGGSVTFTASEQKLAATQTASRILRSLRHLAFIFLFSSFMNIYLILTYCFIYVQQKICPVRNLYGFHISGRSKISNLPEGLAPSQRQIHVYTLRHS